MFGGQPNNNIQNGQNPRYPSNNQHMKNGNNGNIMADELENARVGSQNQNNLNRNSYASGQD